MLDLFPANTLMSIRNRILKVELCGYRGRILLNLRWQYIDKDTGQLYQTKDGISIPAQALPDILAALKKIEEQMIKDGVLEYEIETGFPKINRGIYPVNF